MNNPTLERLNGFFRRFYPIPEALLGYLFGILTALVSEKELLLYAPLPLKSALVDALATELPFLFAAALLAFIRPSRAVGGMLILLKAACCGYGALCVSFDYPSIGYFQYVLIAILQLALYACPIRHAADRLGRSNRLERGEVVDYLLRWLFYSGVTLLILPLKYLGNY